MLKNNKENYVEDFDDDYDDEFDDEEGEDIKEVNIEIDWGNVLVLIGAIAAGLVGYYIVTHLK